MAADERRIVIELKNVGSVQDGKKDTGTSLESDGSYNLSAAMSKGATTGASIANTAWISIMTTIAKQTLDNFKQVAVYDINKFFNLRDDYIGEMRLNHIKTAWQKGQSLMGAMSAGATMGAAGGTAGAVLGALMGGTFWAVSELISSYQRADTQRIALDNAKYQSAFQMTRLGLIDGGRGTEN